MSHIITIMTTHHRNCFHRYTLTHQVPYEVGHSHHHYVGQKGPRAAGLRLLCGSLPLKILFVRRRTSANWPPLPTHTIHLGTMVQLSATSKSNNIVSLWQQLSPSASRRLPIEAARIWRFQLHLVKVLLSSFSSSFTTMVQTLVPAPAQSLGHHHVWL